MSQILNSFNLIQLTLVFLPYLPIAFQTYSKKDLESLPSVDFSQADASKTDIIYYLFTNSTQTTALIIDDEYKFSEDDKKKPTKFFMHGYTSNVTSPWYTEMKTEYFRKGPHNIIYIDWYPAANKAFLVSAANVKPIGEYIANFIINSQIPLENIHLIGHSLGSQLAGHIGKSIHMKTEKKLSRITATDPAGPGFSKVDSGARLNTDDAIFIDVIHTDDGYFGLKKPIGHVDFYVNGGTKQPGCPSREVDENCSHARSNDYFIESINTKGVTAKPAMFNESGTLVLLTKSDEIQFGDSVPTTARGMYYLETNATRPFLITHQKIINNES